MKRESNFFYLTFIICTAIAFGVGVVVSACLPVTSQVKNTQIELISVNEQGGQASTKNSTSIQVITSATNSIGSLTLANFDITGGNDNDITWGTVTDIKDGSYIININNIVGVLGTIPLTIEIFNVPGYEIKGTRSVDIYTSGRYNSNGTNWRWWMGGDVTCTASGMDAKINHSYHYKTKDLVIPNEIEINLFLFHTTHIGMNAFADSDITGTLTIPKSVTIIDGDAFARSTKINRIVCDYDVGFDGNSFHLWAFEYLSSTGKCTVKNTGSMSSLNLCNLLKNRGLPSNWAPEKI